jgi:hypothetical protein
MGPRVGSSSHWTSSRRPVLQISQLVREPASPTSTCRSQCECVPHCACSAVELCACARAMHGLEQGQAHAERRYCKPCTNPVSNCPTFDPCRWHRGSHAPGAHRDPSLRPAVARFGMARSHPTLTQKKHTYAALHPALSCACTRGVTLFTHADQHGPTATRENLSAQRSHLITVWPSTTQHDARSAARAVVGAARARPSVASLAEVHTRDPAAPSVRTHRIRGPAGSHVRGADPRAWDTPCDAGESSATRAGVPACPRRVARRRRCEAEGQRHGARGSRGFVMHMRRTLPQVHTTTQRRCPPRQHPHPDE